MNIELTDVQMEMLQGLLYMVRFTKGGYFEPSDVEEYTSLCAALNVDNAISHFDADSRDSLSGIELFRSYR